MPATTTTAEPTLCGECTDGQVEHNVLGTIVERRCAADGCDDGIVR